MNYLIRVGQFGQIGRFRSQFEFELQHLQKVVCRTERGLEIGEFLERDLDGSDSVADGELLREMTDQDFLLNSRLEKNKVNAVADCQKLIDERKLPVAILDAEQTFDGKKLFFYFAGQVTQEVDDLTTELAETYDAQVKFSEFAETLAKGCGPDCGTGESGCSTGGCSSCGLKSACKS